MRGAAGGGALALGAVAALLGAAFGDGVAGAAAGVDAVALLALGAVALAAAALAGAALARRPAAAGAPRAAGVALLGAGAGMLAAAALTAAGARLPGAAGAPELRERAAGGARLILSGGLREEPLDPPAGREILPFRALQRRRRRVDVLLVGFPGGRVLGEVLALRNRRITVLESDGALVAAAARRWPALAAALADGSLRVVGGNPRRALARLEGRFDLVALVEGWSPEARAAGALNRRRDPRLTVEGFRGLLARVGPKGFLLLERAGAARALLTLREAAGDDARFPGQVAVLRARGGGRTRIWYRPAGLATDRTMAALGRHLRATGALELYRPLGRNRWNFYYPLVTGGRPKGLAFSTLADLSPPRDDRPYFDHGGRMRLTPTGALLPDEPWTPGEERRAAPVPRGDAKQLLVLAAALGVLALGVASGARAVPRGGGRDAGAGDLGRAAAAGAGLVLALAALPPWADLVAPSPALAAAAAAGGLAGAGVGWLAVRRASGARALRTWPLTGAGAAAAATAGAYALAPHLHRLGSFPAALAVLAACAGAGLAGGAGAGAALAAATRRLGGRAGRGAACAAAGAAAAWAAAPLLAASLGARALWTLAAVALLAARPGRAA